MRSSRRPHLLAILLVAACGLALVPTAAAGPPYGSRVMKMGTKGSDVGVLQGYLTRIGYPTKRDGQFGKRTRLSVIKFERSRKRRIDGRVSIQDARKIKGAVTKLGKGKKKKPKKPKNPPSAQGRYYLRGGSTPSVTVSAPEEGNAQVEVVNASGAVVNTLTGSSSGGSSGGVSVGSEATVSWYGRTAAGKPAPDDVYRFRAVAGSGASISGGQTAPFDYRNHIFPIRGAHDYGGAGSRFGAPRSGHTHQGQDVSAACGTKLVAVQGGKVRYRAYQAGGAGHYLVTRGQGTGQDYVYMHLMKPAVVGAGAVIKTGQFIGQVGTTGSSTGCHLHFERWTKPGWYEGGKPYDPLKFLRYWDSYS